MNSLSGTQPASNLPLDKSKEYVSNILRAGIATVVFEKKDGTQRTMRCTLKEDLVIPHERKTDRVKEPKEDILPVWDCDLSAWRTITIPNIISVEWVA